MRDVEGLITRMRRIRRVAAGIKTPVQTGGGVPGADSNAARVEALQARVAHLEQLVEGLQDSVYRESERHARLIAELQERIQPGAMGAALSRDARDRGL